MSRDIRQLRSFARPVKAVWRVVTQWIDNRLSFRFRAITHLVPMGEFAEEDVFVVGYPKSGNTWFQHLVVGVVYGVDPEYAPHALVQELVPGVQGNRFYKRYRTPMFFKSHHSPRSEYRFVIYLLRDGRDVMVSYFHHQTALKGREIDFLEMVQSGKGLLPCKWHEHVEAWLSNPYDAQMIVIKFEDLKKDPVNELRRFCEFVGVERDDAFLESVVGKTSFEKMRQKEVRDGWAELGRWQEDKFFTRRGEVGSYKDEMPLDVLDAFVHDARDTLSRCGYPVDTPE